MAQTNNIDKVIVYCLSNLFNQVIFQKLQINKQTSKDFLYYATTFVSLQFRTR